MDPISAADDRGIEMIDSTSVLTETTADGSGVRNRVIEARARSYTHEARRRIR